jgi:hypothetical protein
MFFGQIDNLIVVRFRYALLKAILDPAVLEERREQSRALLSERDKHRMKFAVAFSAICILLLIFLAVYLFTKIRRHSTCMLYPLPPRSAAIQPDHVLDLPGLPATVYLSPLLPGLTGALPALHIGQDSAV